MKVYISGKIGEEVISEATRQKFARAEEMLRAKGYRTLNPTDSFCQHRLKECFDKDCMDDGRGGVVLLPRHFLNKRGGGLHYDDILAQCLLWLKACDAIYMLPDFLDSKGAKAEYAFAIATGKQVYYDEELFRDGTLRGKFYQKNRLPEVSHEEK